MSIAGRLPDSVYEKALKAMPEIFMNGLNKELVLLKDLAHTIHTKW
jgi:hypothetical protein